MSVPFYPIMPANNHYFVPNYQYVMHEQEYSGKYDYRIVVDPKRNDLWIIRQCENPNSGSYFLCLIHSGSYEDNYYLGIMNMTTNICYYLRNTTYNNFKISYYEDINNGQYHVPIYDIPIYDIDGGYIGVVQTWSISFTRANYELPIKIGDYTICNKRAMSPVATQVFTENPIIPVVEAVIVKKICNILKSSETSINFESDSLLRNSIVNHMKNNQELLFTMVPNNQEEKELISKFLKILMNAFNCKTDNIEKFKNLNYVINDTILKLYIPK